MITRIGRPSPITPAEITALIGLAKAIWTFFGQKKCGVDPRVEKAITAVEAEAGLTDDVKWAWNWFDDRYVAELGDTYWDTDWTDKDYEAALDELRRTGKVEGFSPWKSYQSYAWKHFYWWSGEWYVKMIEGCLGRIFFHLEREIGRLAESIGYEIQPWYKKYLPYGLMAGLGIALILVLTGGRREVRVIYLPAEKK